MKTSEFRKIIREEIKSVLKEGSDWILLKSIKHAIDSYGLFLMPLNPNGTIDMYTEINPDELEYKSLIKKLDSRDRKTYEMVKKEAGK